MVVPPTPLHTSRVLTEDKELWDDVKVGLCPDLFISRIRPQGGSEGTDLQHKLFLSSSNRRRWPVPWPPCVLTMTRWRSKTWTCPATLCSTRGERGPCPNDPTQEEVCNSHREETFSEEHGEIVIWQKKVVLIYESQGEQYFPILMSLLLFYSLFISLHSKV